MILSSCSFNLVNYQEKNKATDVFPIRPDVISYTKPPVIEKIGENYLVTPEMVKTAIQLKEYDDRIQSWKLTFEVK